MDGKVAGFKYTVTLNEGQTYYVKTPYFKLMDLSGSRVTVKNGCKPIAVFSGAEGTNIPYRYGASDILYEQLFPVNSFGKSFITPTIKGRNVYRVRVFAAYPNTRVNIDGNYFTTLAKNDFYEFESKNQPKYILTSNPAQVVVYAPGQDYDVLHGPYNEGDPTMMVIPPIEQNIKESIFLSPGMGALMSPRGGS